MKCSIFSSAKSKWPSGEIYLPDWLASSRYETIVSQIRQTDDKQKLLMLKQQLPAITPSGIFRKRQSSSLIIPSNVICIDIDGKDNPSLTVDEMKNLIIRHLNYVMYCGLSVSGTGLYSMIRYEDYKLHKLYFNYLYNAFQKVGLQIDISCSDICRLRFASYDPNPYINFDAAILKETSCEHCNRKRSDNTKMSNLIEQIESKEGCNPTISIEEQILDPLSHFEVQITPSNLKKKVDDVINLICSNGLDITCEYKDWFSIGCAINATYGIAGAKIFHNISRFYPNYLYEETESLYNKICTLGYLKPKGIILEIARKYGIRG